MIQAAVDYTRMEVGRAHLVAKTEMKTMERLLKVGGAVNMKGKLTHDSVGDVDLAR